MLQLRVNHVVKHTMQFYRILVFLLCAVSLSVTATDGADKLTQQRIVIPKPSNLDTPVNHYIKRIITRALAQVDIKADIHYSSEPMNQKRSALSLVQGKYINLTWLPYSREHEEQLISIKMPLYKGMHGMRILLINKASKARFAQVKTVDDLKGFIGLQKQSWSDYQVLIDNGLTVNGDLDYNSMHKALNNNLADYFPRSSMAVLAEYERNKLPNVMIEPNLILHYPQMYVFYVSKHTPGLAQSMEQGMRALVDSGEFDEIFSEFYAGRFVGLNMANRRKIELKFTTDMNFTN